MNEHLLAIITSAFDRGDEVNIRISSRTSDDHREAVLQRREGTTLIGQFLDDATPIRLQESVIRHEGSLKIQEVHP